MKESDIDRIKNFARILGIKVDIRDKSDPTALGYYDMNSRSIEVFRTARTSKEELVSTISHELGHALDHRYNEGTEEFEEYDKAIEVFSNYKTTKIFPTDEQIKIILKREHIADSIGWNILDILFIKKDKFKKDLSTHMENFIWTYFMKNKKDPPRRIRRIERKRFKENYNK